MTEKSISRGLVLSGGGARGAYEAGVLAYICNELENSKFNILSGTSVGAVHASYLTACAHTRHYSMNRLLDVWRAFQLKNMLLLSAWDVCRLPYTLQQLFSGKPPEQGLFLNTDALYQMVCRDIPWPYVQANLQDGWVESLTISTTHIASGKTVVFIDCPRLGVPPWTRDYRRLAKPARIGPLHALASAAIPILFPAICIDGIYYCDGGLRQNTPLSPALRCGADRVLVVSVGHGREQPLEPVTPALLQESYPQPQVLLGKVFNALLLDHLDYDLAQLRGINRLLKDGQRAFGQQFLTNISKTSQQIRGQSYRNIDTLVVRPSRDLGHLAADFIQQESPKTSPLTAWFLQYLAGVDHVGHNADLLSYLLFDGAFAAKLIALGMNDADSQREALIDFFKD